jgi:DNA (cytosine-5)-methyltransferase 1
VVYYNENDPQIAEWLQAVIDADLIAPGVVDTRSIEDVEPSDLDEFSQCHFFAGIGGWSYALRLADWPDDRPVWTGSCPCQPFSSAGKRAGFADERHLWPAWHWLIQQCRPRVIFGEQVATALAWDDLVQGDLEAAAYTRASVIVGAHSVGSPHLRQRLYWVADTNEPRSQGWGRTELSERAGECVVGAGGPSGELAYADTTRCGTWRASETCDGRDAPRQQPTGLRDVGGFAESDGSESCDRDLQRSGRLVQFAQDSPLSGSWSAADWLWCADDKYRPVEPGSFPLAHGVPARVGRLRGYGNAIVPALAAEVIKAYSETLIY